MMSRLHSVSKRFVSSCAVREKNSVRNSSWRVSAACGDGAGVVVPACRLTDFGVN